MQGGAIEGPRTGLLAASTAGLQAAFTAGPHVLLHARGWQMVVATVRSESGRGNEPQCHWGTTDQHQPEQQKGSSGGQRYC